MKMVAKTDGFIGVTRAFVANSGKNGKYKLFKHLNYSLLRPGNIAQRVTLLLCVLSYHGSTIEPKSSLK